MLPQIRRGLVRARHVIGRGSCAPTVAFALPFPAAPSPQALRALAGGAAAGVVAAAFGATSVLADTKPTAPELSRMLEAKGRLKHLNMVEYILESATPGPRLEYFVGNSDGSTTESWCPDCRHATPMVLASALEIGLPLIAVGGGIMPAWKSSSHPWRAANGLGLKGLPTLRLVDSDGVEVARLGAELEDPDVRRVRAAVDKLVRRFAADEHSRKLEVQGRLTHLDTELYGLLSPPVGPYLELFTGNCDGSTRGSWCPDCRQAVPMVLASVADSSLQLVTVGVGNKATWKSSAHPFRETSGLGLKGIPTLRLIDGQGREITRLGAELEDPDTLRVRELLDAVARLGA